MHLLFSSASQPFHSRHEWVLPDVLPGICRLFLHLHVTGTVEKSGRTATHWRTIDLGAAGLKMYRIYIDLDTPLAGAARLEAIFPDEPTLDQMEALVDLASRIEQGGVPALVGGRF